MKNDLSHMDRRDFMTLCAGAVPAAVWGGRSAPPAASHQRPPNILWIMTDQQPWDAMSCAGNSQLHTPAMDQLAADGVRFENTYCTNPISVPSRTSMMTGCMPYETNVMFNMNRFNVRAESLGRRIKAAGYDTAYIGKWHIPMQSDQAEWTGFDLMMEGTYAFNDQHFAEPAITYLRREHDRPFFLVVSFNNPHDICEYARKLANYGERDQLWNGPIPDPPPVDELPPLPDNFAIPDHEPDIIRAHQSWIPPVYPSVGWTEAQWREYRWALNRLTERVDGEIGRILRVLHEQDLAENTLIVFLSDHGDGNGAHQWNQKTLLYEEPARVPFILSGPMIDDPGRTDSAHLVSSGLDLFPTLCDYARIDVPENLRGRSLRPLAEGRAVTWRDQVVSTCTLHRRFDHTTGIEGRMLRTEDFKYIVYSAGRLREQLFDMQRDPGEMNNLAVDPTHRALLQSYRERLAGHVRDTGDYFVVPEVPSGNWILTPSRSVASSA